MSDDLALDTALEILDGTICECGHVNTEHLRIDGESCIDGCDCTVFRPVDFFVTRASITEEES